MVHFTEAMYLDNVRYPFNMRRFLSPAFFAGGNIVLLYFPAHSIIFKMTTGQVMNTQLKYWFDESSKDQACLVWADDRIACYCIVTSLEPDALDYPFSDKYRSFGAMQAE